MDVQPMPEDWERAVAVIAHPDDLEYGAASAVARWTRQGKKVSYLLATLGEAGIEFDADQFLRDMAGYVGLAAGVEYAVSMRHYSTG